jgi:peptide/nickel transport system permease protein
MTAVSAPAPAVVRRRSGVEFRRYLKRNPSLAIGLVMVGALLLFTWSGGSSRPGRAFPPGAALTAFGRWFGTDAKGRNLFAVMVYGTVLTLKIGLIAGFLGVFIGTIVAFISAYRGGWLDAVVRVLVDVLITVPTLLVLVVVASAIQSSMSTTVMAITIALLAWREPTRQIRAQVLVMREAPYVLVARLNGAGPMRIIFRELIPNLLPYLGASLIMAVAQAVLASIGLEALGLVRHQADSG